MSRLTTHFNISNIVRLIYCLAFLWLIIYLLFYNTFAFNYETYLNQQYTLVFWLPILALVLIWRYKNGGYITYKSAIGLLLIALVSCFLCFSYYYSFGNEYFFTISILVVACYGLLWLNHINLLHGIISAFVLLFLVEFYLGLEQLFSLENNNGLSITGSLQNSGVYAYYLVFNLPFFYWFCFSFSRHFFKKNYLRTSNLVFKLLFALISIGVFYLIYCTQSRTAFICLAVTTGFFLFLKYKNEIPDKVKTLPKSILLTITIIGIGGTAWGSVWLFNFKKLSAIGRILMLNITWQNIADHFWLGTGLGRFTWYYPQWQADYFNTHTKPILAYFFSADESYIVFNEYLQLFTTIGLFGFLLCGFGLYRFFKLRAVNDQNLLLAAKCTLLAILCSGFTSYPLHVNIILLLLGTCLAIGFAVGDREIIEVAKSPKLYFNSVLITLCLFLVCYTFIKGYLAYNATKKWAAVRNLNNQNASSRYKQLYPLFNNDGKFLIEYGTFLLADSTSNFMAISTLEKAKQLIITRQGVEALTKAYSNAAKYDAAIINQQFLVNYLPNKFLPKYNLLRLYVLKNDAVKVKEMGEKILQMPVKIPSYEVLEIQENTRKILKEYL